MIRKRQLGQVPMTLLTKDCGIELDAPALRNLLAEVCQQYKAKRTELEGLELKVNAKRRPTLSDKEKMIDLGIYRLACSLLHSSTTVNILFDGAITPEQVQTYSSLFDNADHRLERTALETLQNHLAVELSVSESAYVFTNVEKGDVPGALNPVREFVKLKLVPGARKKASDVYQAASSDPRTLLLLLRVYNPFVRTLNSIRHKTRQDSIHSADTRSKTMASKAVEVLDKLAHGLSSPNSFLVAGTFVFVFFCLLDCPPTVEEFIHRQNVNNACLFVLVGKALRKASKPREQCLEVLKTWLPSIEDESVLKLLSQTGKKDEGRPSISTLQQTGNVWNELVRHVRLTSSLQTGNVWNELVNLTCLTLGMDSNDKDTYARASEVLEKALTFGSAPGKDVVGKNVLEREIPSVFNAK